MLATFIHCKILTNDFVWLMSTKLKRNYAKLNDKCYTETFECKMWLGTQHASEIVITNPQRTRKTKIINCRNKNKKLDTSLPYPWDQYNASKECSRPSRNQTNLK
jgi:hypothetical protein